MTTSRTRKERGKKYEKRIAEKIHQALLLHNTEYKHLYETLENPELKPQRDSSSGTFTRSTGDIDLGLARKFFPFTTECKDWKSLDITLDAIFKQKIKSLTSIWNKQIIPAMNKTELEGILVFKAQRTLDFCFLPVDKMPQVFLNRDNFTSIVYSSKWIIAKFDEFIKTYLTMDKIMNELSSTGLL